MAGKLSQATHIPTTVDRTADKFEVTKNSTVATYYATVNDMLNITGAPVGTTDTQAISGKTLNNTNTITIKASLLTLQDATDTSKQANFVLSGITTATTRSYTLPNANGTLADLASSQNFTNKTLTSPTINTPTINNPTLNVDAISEFTVGNGTTVGGVKLKSGALVTSNSVITANITDGNVTPAKLVAGTGSGWASASWSPTLANLTQGSGALTAKYVQIGKWIFYRFVFTYGAGSAVGTAPTFTLPTTPVAWGQSGSSSLVIGTVWFEDTGVANYQGTVSYSTGNTAAIFVGVASGTYFTTTAVTAAIPFTFANGDSIDCQGFYETA